MLPNLRLARETDADTLLVLMQEYYAYDGHTFHHDAARSALLQLLHDPSLGATWLISDGDTVVGYIVLTYGFSLEFLGRDSFIDEFFLRENYRGRGWGRQALQSVEDFARGHNITAIHLEVVRANQNALQVYRKLGFSDRGHYLMTKPLPRP
jgi:GNAT superfamily N-acetyltransferase